MRLDKLLSNLGYGSRNDLKKACKNGRVLVNNEKVLDSSFDVDPQKDLIVIDDEEIYFNDNIVIMMNKPKGYICSNIDEKYPTVLNLIDNKYRRLDLDIAGRLDVDTTGLVILSNDGNLIHKIISPNNCIYKKYLVETKDVIGEDFLKEIVKPMALIDKKGEYFITEKAMAELLDENHFYLDIKEGKYHQVKKMVEHLGNEVLNLKRISIGSLDVSSLNEGEYKILNQEEIRWIFNE